MPTQSKSRARIPSGGAEPTGAACDISCVDLPRLRRARDLMKPAATMAAVAETFRVLGDPTRMRIVWALVHEELCVCDLAALLGVSQSVVSHSLRALRELRLVRHRRAGRVVYYALEDEHIGHILGEAVCHVEEGATQP